MNTQRNVRILTWFNFFLEFKPYAPIVILYFASVTGSFTLGLSIFSIITISAALLEVPTGILSDKAGRKKTIALGTLASIFGIVLWALGGSYAVLAAGAILIGLGEALFSGNNAALLHDTLKELGRESEFSESFGKTSSMLQAGLAFSALIGGYLTLWSLQTVLMFSVVPLVICFMLTLFIVEPRVYSRTIQTNIFSDLKEVVMEFRKNGKLKLVSATSILRYGVEETMFQFTPAFIALFWPVWALGLFRFVAHGLSIISYWFSGAVIKRFGAAKTAFFGNLIDRTTGIIAVVFPSRFSPILLMGSFYGLNEVSEETLLQKEFTDHQRATMASLNSFFGNICFAVFAIVLGVIADSFGARMGLLVGELLLLPLPFLLWKILKWKT
jgi:MFS family permease